MKKLFICILILSASLTTVKAKNIVSHQKSIVYAEITPFFKLIRDGNFDVVKSMIESGQNVNKKSNGLTPLMFAARYNKAEIAKLLIDNGAKLNTKSDKGGFTALKWAELVKATETINVIKASMKK